MKTNVLYYGDNLDILRHHIPDDSIDLIYLDPPFNSNRNYNVLFREEAGGGSHAQIEAFEDTWNWAGAASSYDEVMRGPHQKVARILKALVEGLGHNEVTAYLTMMAIRLIELHRVLAAVHAAHKLGRQWIGIDITHLAIGLIRRRMTDAFPTLDIEVIGEPVDLTGARELASKDKYQFQWWALDKLGAQPVAGKKKGSDKGIDGVIPFFAGNAPGKSEYARAIVSVKGGEHAGVAAIRDLKGVLDREKEPIGILLTLSSPTKDMITEAASSGFYESDFWKKKYPRVQIMTVLDVLTGKRPDMPWGGSPFAKAPAERERAEQERLV